MFRVLGGQRHRALNIRDPLQRLWGGGPSFSVPPTLAGSRWGSAPGQEAGDTWPRKRRLRPLPPTTTSTPPTAACAGPTPGARACRGWGFVHLARSWPLPLYLKKKKKISPKSSLTPSERMLKLFNDTCYRTVGQTLLKGAVSMGSHLIPTRRN